MRPGVKETLALIVYRWTHLLRQVTASRHFLRGCLSIFCVHSSSLFSVRFPAAVHAASPLTSSSNARDDELGCHRLAAGGGSGRPARYFVHYNTGRELNCESTLNIYSACCVSPHATLSRFSLRQSFSQLCPGVKETFPLIVYRWTHLL